MSLLAKKYNLLKPTALYLSDKVVLAQAWKKAHQYIRSTNWYADTFELDRSALNLNRLLDKWIVELKSDAFSFDPLRLVPAPKAQRWDFHEKSDPASFEELINRVIQTENYSHTWRPVEEAKPLRPLAHVGIRDQTLLMALMMCLANKVESIQGDTSTSFSDVHAKKVSNYGNRLYCHYSERNAFFSWGNSTSYSKYFSDYQKFLSRPLFFGGEALQQKIYNEQVYEIQLDIAKFYDQISRPVLTEKIRSLCEENNDPVLEKLLTSFEKWEWDDTSSEIYNLVCKSKDEDIPTGIPQGLVIGGFLANIFLIEFDNEIQSQCGQLVSPGIRIVDYCRYVDDMRLIVVVENQIAAGEIKKQITELIGIKLQEIGLKLNDEKTRVDKFRYKRAGISTKLKDIQKKVSGPLSAGEIDEQLGHLEGLIGLADNLRIQASELDNTNPLATIEMPSNDVRDDTLLRFSANKIHTLLNQKRSFFAPDVDQDGNFKPGSWDYLQERMARKFIAHWSKDPSLVLLLKKGLELFPDRKILSPVLSQLKEVLSRNEEPKQVQLAQYCLGEIFRHSATTIHSKKSSEFPSHADVDGFFETLQSFAVEIIAHD